MAPAMIVRSLLRLRPVAAFRRYHGSTPSRSLSCQKVGDEEEVYEMKKWEKITCAGVVACTVLAAFNLSKGQHENPQPPPYPYLHIRNKDFPWGPDSLFETIKKKKESARREATG